MATRLFLHLFNAKYTDIMKSLENYSQIGVTHILISPPCLTISSKEWWARYQPLHYLIIDGPLGTKDQLQLLCKTANQYQIGIVADVVLNHTATFNYNGKSLNVPSIEAIAAHNSSSITKQYNSLPNEYKVMFTENDFYKNDTIKNYDDRHQVLYGKLGKLMDLDQSSPRVMEMQIQYLKLLVQIGITGIRLDAVKHMPELYISQMIRIFERELISKYSSIPTLSCVVMEIICTTNTIDRDITPYIFSNQTCKIPIIYYDFPFMNNLACYILDDNVYLQPIANPEYQVATKELLKFYSNNNMMSFITNHDIVYNDCFKHWLIVKPLDKRMAYIVSLFFTNIQNFYIFNDNVPGTAYYDEINSPDLIKLLQFRKANPSLKLSPLVKFNKSIENKIYMGKLTDRAFFIINNDKYTYNLTPSWPQKTYDIEDGIYLDIFTDSKLEIKKEKGMTFNIQPSNSHLFIKQSH